MKSKRLLLLILAMVVITVWPAAGAPPGLYSDVPQNHWAYDALQSLLQIGFDSGIPDGTFSGRRALTRADFATVTARIAYQGSVRAGIGWADQPQYRTTQNFPRLAAEFAPELRTLKLDGPAFQHRRGRFEAACRDGRPLGVEAPLVPPFSILDEAARADGARLAEEEWQRSAISLQLADRDREPQIELPLAIPLSYLGDKKDVHRDDMISGHNAEIWRLLRDHHPAPDAKLSWLGAVFDLPSAWREYGVKSLKIDGRHPGALVPHSDARLLWEPHQSDWERRRELREAPDGRLVAPSHPTPPRWELILDAPRAQITQRVPLPSQPGEWRLAWGPHGSGVYFVKWRVKDDDEMPFRLYAVDLHTGGILNAAAAAE